MVQSAPQTEGNREMARYTATIRHHSIARARVVPVGDTLAIAKSSADHEFGDGYLEHTIEIHDTQIADPWHGTLVASRRLDARRWATPA
jgi:hypothetical protein